MNLLDDILRRANATKEERQEIYDLIEKDPMTHLYNKVAFEKHIKLISSMKRRKEIQGSCCLMIDIDDFKRINDTYGHDRGDEVIIEFSQHLQDYVRDYDVRNLYRYGEKADEFLILLLNKNLEIGKTVAERVVERTRKDCEFTTSCGLSHYDLVSENTDKLIIDADTALRLAKKRGKNQVVVYSQGIAA
jgi:diguanylate cyclase (GGDEF)-like protein